MAVPEIAEFGRSPAATFGDIHWRWWDVATGLAPLTLTFAIPLLLSREAQYALPRWLWIPLAILDLTWMLAYPMWVARRRSALPSLPSLRSVTVEALIALPAIPLVMAALAGVDLLLSSFMGLVTPSTPFEGIAGAPETYQGPALLLVAVAGAPIAEEVFFRGMLYNALRRRMHFLLAAVVQGLVFGLAHPFGLEERLQVSVMGISFALLYEWRRTLAAPVILHALINAVSIAVLFHSLAVAANAPVLGVRGTAQEEGCRITEVVPGGAAEVAGLHVGDVITLAGENSVRDQGDLILIMRTKKVGDRIPIRFARDGRSLRVEALLKARHK